MDGENGSDAADGRIPGACGDELAAGNDVESQGAVMALARRLYRGCKVWAEVDDQGRLVERRGLVQIRYRQEADQGYSARAGELAEIDPAAAPASSAPPSAEPSSGEPSEAAAPTPPKRRRKASPRPRKTAAPRAADGSDPEGEIVAYADGSCFGNPGPAGVGVLLEWKGHTREVSRFLGDGTNNIAELTAIEVALEQVKNRRLPVRVHTDSAYAIGVLSEGWKVQENRELVARVQALMREFADLRLVKVRGHSGDPRNDRVDRLARDAITRRA